MSARCLRILAFALLIMGAPLATEAALTYDLRLLDGGKIAYYFSTGETVQMELWAQVTGSSSGVEGFQNGFGSIVSSGATVTGTLGATLTAPFNATGSGIGKAQDLNSDGGRDLGSNGTHASSDFFFARAGAMQSINTGVGQSITNGAEFKIATVTFTIGNAVDTTGATPVLLNFRVTSFADVTGIEALWQEDGQARNPNAGGGGALPTAGLDVQIFVVPEVSSGGLLGLGALLCGFVRRRRQS